MKRPFGVTILLWLVLSLTAWSGLRLASAIVWWQTLLEFMPRPGPLYIAISAGVWLILGIGLLWGMWQVKAWVRTLLLGAGVGFLIWYWCDRLLFQSSSANWPFAVGASVLLIVLLSVCTNLPGTKIYFSKSEAHDR